MRDEIRELVPVVIYFFIVRHESLAPAWNLLATPHFWAIQIRLIILFLVFCASRELYDVLAPRRARELFVGGRSSPSA